MGELWDLYDKNRKKIGKLAERGVYKFKEGEYHIVVNGVIINSKNEILITKRAEFKDYGLMWECNGGSILAGETSLDGIIRELKEEIGVEFTKKEAIFLKTEERISDFKDMWLFRRDIKDEEITLPDGEAIDFKWVDINEFIDMFNKNEIVPTIMFGMQDYNKALTLKQRDSYGYIGKSVNVKIDRPLGSIHPKWKEIKYPINYGYIPNTLSGDGEEIDCYILGINEPLEEFSGEVIAVINRTNDDDDKLIVVPSGMNYKDEEIRELVDFQEKYFESDIIR